MPTYFKDQVARVICETIRAYTRSQGGPEFPTWENTKPSTVENYMFLVNSHWDKDLSPEAAHEMWIDHMLADGWQYGEVFDVEKRTHPAMVSFHELKPDSQLQLQIARAIVCAMRPGKPTTQVVAAQGFEDHAMGVV